MAYLVRGELCLGAFSPFPTSTPHATNSLAYHRHNTDSLRQYRSYRDRENKMSLTMRWKLIIVVLLALAGLTCCQRQLGKNRPKWVQ